MKSSFTIKTLNNHIVAPPSSYQTVLGFWGRAMIATITPLKAVVRTRKDIVKPAMPKRFGVLSAPMMCFLAITCFALLFIAQPNDARAQASVIFGQTQAENTILIFFATPVTISTDTTAADFAIDGVASSPMVTKIEPFLGAGPTAYKLVLSSNIFRNDVITLSYIQTQGTISNPGGNLENFTININNLVTSIPPPPAAKITYTEINTDGDTIKLTFDKDITANNVPPSDFTVIVERGRFVPDAGTAATRSVTVNSVSASGKILTLSLQGSIAHGNLILVSYEPSTPNKIEANDGQGVDGFGSSRAAVIRDRVFIISPSQDVSTNSFTIEGTVYRQTNVTYSVQLLKNGGAFGSTVLGAEDIWSQTVTLQSGANTITATATDSNGNTSTSNVVVITLQEKPTVIITSGSRPSGYIIRDTRTVNYTATFGVPVTGFDANDITLTGTVNDGRPEVSKFVDNGDGKTYTFAVASGSSDGAVTVSIPADVAHSGANGNVASVPYKITFETTPTVTISSSSGVHGAIINADTLNYTATFSRAVEGFDVSDITVAGTANEGNPQVSNFNQVLDADSRIRIYTFDVARGSSEGSVTVSIAAGVAKDLLNKGNTASNQYTLTFDTAPTVEITSTTGDSGVAVDANTLSYTVTFNEAVGSFDGADITLTGTVNGGAPVVSNFAGSGNVYTFEVLKGSSDGSVTVSIPADVARDSVGNGNTASNQYTLTIDTTRPTVSITSDSGDNEGVVNVGTLHYTATFNESVEDFDEGDITLIGTANGGAPVVSNFAGSGKVYTFEVLKGSSNGTVNVSIVENVVHDSVGNGNTVSNLYELTVAVRLTVEITSTTGDSGTAVSTNTLSYTAEFDQAVSGFNVEKITVTGADTRTYSLSNFVAGTDSRTYTFDVVRSGEDTTNGTVTVSIPENAAHSDGGTNGNTASNPYTLIIAVQPTARITYDSRTDDGFTVAAETLTFTATFSEPVTIVESTFVATGMANGGDPVVSNVVGHGKVYTFDVARGISDGTVEVQVFARRSCTVHDDYDGRESFCKGKLNNPSEIYALTIDTTHPSVTISSSSGDSGSIVRYEDSQKLNYTATFDEVVNDFDETDITLTGTAVGASVINLVSTDSKTYTFDVIKGSSDGSVIVFVAANAARDGAGNGNTESNNRYELTFDSVPLFVRISSSQNADTLSFTATFNKSVSGFDVGSITVTGSAEFVTSFAASADTDDKEYTFEVVKGVSYGVVTVFIDTNAAYDHVGRGNSRSAPHIVTFSTPPIITTTTRSVSSTQALVQGTAESGVTVKIYNGRQLDSVGSVSAENGAWEFTVQLALGANEIKAVAVSGNIESEPSNAVTITRDNARPSVIITSGSGDSGAIVGGPSLGATLSYTATFNEPVGGFDVGTITVTGVAGVAFATNLVASTDSRTYTFEVARSNSDGDIIVSIPANAARDSVGNKNYASNRYRLTIDTTRPTVRIESGSGDSGVAVDANTLSYTVTFNETVGSFDGADITLTGTVNGGAPVVSNFAGSDNVYTFEVLKGSSDGSVTVSIPAGVARDSVGNGNTASNQYTLTIDTTPPTVEITSDSGNNGGTVNVGTLSYKVTFDESVEDFDEGDITLTGTANGGAPVVSNFAGSGKVYTFEVLKGSSNGTVNVSIVENVVHDSVGNGNTVSNLYELTVAVRLTVEITSTTGDSGTAVGTNTLSYTAEFDQAVSGFNVEKITVTGADTRTYSLSNFVAGIDSRTYTFDVVRSGEDTTNGTVTVSIPENAAHSDGGTNGNTASDPYTLIIAVRPAVRISSDSGADGSTVTARSVTFTATFSEPVTIVESTFVATGMANGGSPEVSNVAGSGKVYTFDVARGSSNGSVKVQVLAKSCTVHDDYDGHDSSCKGKLNNPSEIYTLYFNNLVLPAPVITTPATVVATRTFSMSGTATAGTTAELFYSTLIGGILPNGAIATMTTLVSLGTETITNGAWNIDFNLLGQDNEMTENRITAIVTGDSGSISRHSSPVIITLDRAGPTVTITNNKPSGSIVNTTALSYVVAFSEPLSRPLDVGSITVIGGTVSNFSPDTSRSHKLYYFDVIGANFGESLTVSIDAGAVQDVVGNDNIASNRHILRILSIVGGPGVTITTTAKTVTNTRVKIEGIAERGATVELFVDTEAGKSSLGTIRAIDGTWVKNLVLLEEGANTFTATAKRMGFAETGTSNVVVITRNTTRPTVTITSSSGNSGSTTSTNTLNYTATFSEAVHDFVASDIEVTGSAGVTTATSFVASTDGRTYTFEVVRGSFDGRVYVFIPANVAQNTLGNENTSVGLPYLLSIDTTPPTVEITTTYGDSGATVNAETLSYTVTFDEAVTGFAVNNITLAGTLNGGSPAVLNFREETPKRIYTFEVASGNHDGDVTVSIAAGVAVDDVGIANVRSDDYTLTIDSMPPTISISDPAETVTTTALFVLNGMADADSAVAVFRNGVSIGAVTVNGSSWSKSTTLELGINRFAAIATDSAGNTATATAITITLDTKPTVTITSGSGMNGDLVNTSSLTYTATFDKVVRDFDFSDIMVRGTANYHTNTVKNSFSVVSGTVYTFAVSTYTDGDIIVSIPANVAHDNGGNSNIASDPFTLSVDTRQPTVAITSTSGQNGETVNDAILRYTVTFSVPVSDFELTDIDVTGSANSGSLVAVYLSGYGAKYTFDVLRGSSDGSVAVSIAADSVQDRFGNQNIASNEYGLTIDTEGPTVEIASATGQNGETVNDATLRYTVTFSEPVSGFNVGSFTVTGSAGASATNLQGSGTDYTFEVEGASDESVYVLISGGAVRDSAGNINIVSAGYRLTIDTALPVIMPPTETVVKTARFTLHGTAGVGREIELFRRSADGGFISVDHPETFADTNGRWTISFTLWEGVNIINAAPIRFLDTVTITLDTTPPTVEITSTTGYSGATVNAETLSYTVTFDEAVTGFDATDIKLTGSANEDHPSVSNFVGNGDNKTYAFEVAKGSSDGSVTVSIPADAARDSVGNSNNATAYTLTIDTTSPTVIITSSSGDADTAVSAYMLYYTATFSEDVTGFDVGDITVTGSAGVMSATNRQGSGAVYTFDVARDRSDGSVTVFIDAGVAHDRANTDNTASNKYTLTIDTVAPSVTITSPVALGSAVNAETLSYTATFSETVYDFSVDDITVTGSANRGNPVASSLLGAGAVYTFEVQRGEGDADGTVSVSIAAGVAVDRAGNGNKASSDGGYTLTIDTIDPDVRITTTPQTVFQTSSFIVNVTVVAMDATVELFVGTGTGRVSLGTNSIRAGDTWAIPVTLVAGANTFTAEAIDIAGNTATSTAVAIIFKPGLPPESLEQLNEDILPQLAQSMLASTMSAVNTRVSAAFSGIPQAGSYQLDGQMVQLDGSGNLQDAMTSKLPHYAKSLKEGTMDWKAMLSRSSFVLPLNANAVGGDGAGGVTIWGSSEYSLVSDKGWEGDVFSLQLGVDQRMKDDLLAGGLVSWSKGDVDYMLEGESGDYTHQITSVHPYLAWTEGDMSSWVSVGYGQGELVRTQAADNTKKHSDTRLLSLSAGVSGRLSQSILKLKSDMTLAQIDIAGSADNSIDSTSISAHNLANQRLRLLLEIDRELQLASGGRFDPLVEIGLRYDGGAGDSSGIGAVLGIGGRYVNTGLTVEGKLHTLVGRKDYQEWSVQGTIRKTASANERGLSFSLSPSYGATSNSASQIWQQNQSDENNSNGDDSARLNVKVGYGLFTGGGLLTPYSELSMGKNKGYRFGLRWKPNSPFDMHLYGGRETGSDSGLILLESHIRF